MAEIPRATPEGDRDGNAPVKEQRAGSTSGGENYGSTKQQPDDPSSPDDRHAGKR